MEDWWTYLISQYDIILFLILIHFLLEILVELKKSNNFFGYDHVDTTAIGFTLYITITMLYSQLWRLYLGRYHIFIVYFPKNSGLKIKSVMFLIFWYNLHKVSQYIPSKYYKYLQCSPRIKLSKLVHLGALDFELFSL